MTRYVGMYRRAVRIAIGSAPDPDVIREAARRAAANACIAGRHRPETDATTGDEVCRRCGAMVDDYADVADRISDLTCVEGSKP